MFAVCMASARMRRITSPSLLTTYDAKVPSGIPSSHAVEIVPVVAMVTRVFAQSAEEGRRESLSAVSADDAGADVAVSVATARGAARATRGARPTGLAAERRLLVPALMLCREDGATARVAADGAAQVAAIVGIRKERVECVAARYPRTSVRVGVVCGGTNGCRGIRAD